MEFFIADMDEYNWVLVNGQWFNHLVNWLQILVLELLQQYNNVQKYKKLSVELLRVGFLFRNKRIVWAIHL